MTKRTVNTLLTCLAAMSVMAAVGIRSVVPAAAASVECTLAALSAINVATVTIVSAAVVPASGSNPAFCNVTGTLATDGEGAGPGMARFAARLPVNWNGKLLASGAGALSGSLMPLLSGPDAAASLVKGYAFVTNDGGHTSGFFDGSWAVLAPGVPDAVKLADYYYRASHQVTVAVKELVKGYYQADRIARSYFDGCSNAGRNGLMAAMRYPDDFDGIIAGAPYLDIRVHLGGYKNVTAFLNAHIPPALVPAIDTAINASCDAADGVTDGLIQNPAKCSFDPQSLVPSVLTHAQADALEIFMRGVRDEKGNLVFPGQSVSDLSSPGGFVPWIVQGPSLDPTAAQPWGAAAPLAWLAADSTLRNTVTFDSLLNSNLEWPEADGIITKSALERFDLATRIGATDQPGRLRRYLRQDKKLILYHGLGDQTLSPFRTMQFYQDLAQRVGGYGKAHENVRLFMVPGMLHCSGGPGPNAFDTLTALENWVEHGVAPDAIVATHYVNNNPALGADRTMPLCKFPEQARFAGSGDVHVAGSWRCSPWDRRMLDVGPNGSQAGLRQEHGHLHDCRRHGHSWRHGHSRNH